MILIVLIILLGHEIDRPGPQDSITTEQPHESADGNQGSSGRLGEQATRVQPERPRELYAGYSRHPWLRIPQMVQNAIDAQDVEDAGLAALWPRVDAASAVSRLSAALQFRTVSHGDEVAPDSVSFRLFHDHLEESFPHVHRILQRETVAGLSLLYTWQGSKPELPSILLMAHLDVVPAPDEHEWTHPPFAGNVADGYIWGRGALDNKQGVMALLEAVEQLAKEGFAPVRTTYLAFGHDEENGGHNGAAKVADLLASRGVRLATVIDEGGVVLSDFLPRSQGPVAAIGVGEKGSISIRLTTNVQGGHSSMPGGRSAVGTLARAVGRVEDSQFPAQVDGVARETLRGLSTTQPLVRRLIVSNMWLFRPLVVTLLSRRPETNAMIRTTVAPTMLSAGTKANVLPGSATATINFRTMPGETLESVIAHIHRAVNDPSVEIRPIGVPREAVSASPTDALAYEMLSNVVRDVHPDDDVLIVPYLVPGGTDSRHFEQLAETIYRFTPMQLSREDASRFHGTDERLPVREYARMIKSYYRLLKALQYVEPR